MSTNPQLKPNAFGGAAWQSGSFNECMSGFEHQAASHLVAEGLVLEGLAVTRAIHDRYHASRRNPFNEIECSDHDARAMASYGTFVSACGFEYNGPAQQLKFSPRLTPENFQAAFVGATGRGTFRQRRQAERGECLVLVKWGRLTLRTLTLDLRPEPGRPVQVRWGGKPVPAAIAFVEGRLVIGFEQPLTLEAGPWLEVAA